MIGLDFASDNYLYDIASSTFEVFMASRLLESDVFILTGD